MLYKNEEFHFSIDVPYDWSRTVLVPFFVNRGGKVAFSPAYQLQKGQNGTLNIAMATNRLIPDRANRERSARAFLRSSDFLMLRWRATIAARQGLLGDEPNTAWMESRILRRDSTLASARGLIEAMRHGVAYTVQYIYTTDTQTAISEMIASFRFET